MEQDQEVVNPRWSDIGALEQSRLQDAIRSGGDVDPRLVPAALEHLDEKRRIGRWMTVGGVGIAVIAGVASGAVVWVTERDLDGALFLAAFMMVFVAIPVVGAGLHLAGQSTQRAQKLRATTASTSDERAGRWSWRIGRVLTAAFLAMMTWWWSNILIVGPAMRATGISQPPDGLGIAIGLAAVTGLGVAYYRLLATRDLL